MPALLNVPLRTECTKTIAEPRIGEKMCRTGRSIDDYESMVVDSERRNSMLI